MKKIPFPEKNHSTYPHKINKPILSKIVTPALKIGLTGGIGSGKTTVAEVFKKLGVPVFNSDDFGKKLLQHNTNIINQVVQEFGDTIIDNKKINTRKLASIVFSDKNKIQTLNQIIHPHVLNQFEQLAKKTQKKYIIKESAILFESNSYKKVNKIILVRAPLDIRIKRVCDRDNRTKEDVEKIISNQIHDSKLLTRVDYIINNNNELLVPQIIRIDKILSHI